MTIKRIISSAVAAMIGLLMTLEASAMTELTPTDAVHKFDIGSDENGGSGVEEDADTERGQNWIKVIQPFNEVNLFEDTGEPDIAAVAVTFEISNWSGKEFNVGWGALITWYDDSGNWFGFSDFKGTSDYVINGDGEYTLVCDLGKFCLAQEQPYGINILQALEMVIDGVDEGDPTVIEVKSVRQYYNGEAVESAKLPDGTEIPIETAALILDDSSIDDTASGIDSESSDDTSTVESTADTSSEAASSIADNNSAVKTESTVSDNSSKDDESSSNALLFGGIGAGAVLLIIIIAVIIKKK